MKLNLSLIAAVVLLVAGTANAAPTMQTCKSMEITHDGHAGMTYRLACAAGSWNLVYTGSVPGGSQGVKAQYKLSATSSAGESFEQLRTVRLSSPAELGQALMRESVVFESGEVALRACDSVGCSTYRPLGNDKKLTKATITVSPELVQLRQQFKESEAKLANANTQLAAAQAQVAQLDRKLMENEAVQADLAQLLKDAQSRYDNLVQAHEANTQEFQAALKAADAAVTAKVLEQVEQEMPDSGKPLVLSQPVIPVDAQSAVPVQIAAEVSRLEVENTKLREELGQVRTLMAIVVDDLAAQVVRNEGIVKQSLQAHEQLKAVATDTLELVTKYKELEQELATLQQALSSANQEVALQKAKVEALELGREMLLSAVSAANADTDSKQLRIQALEREVEELNAQFSKAATKGKNCTESSVATQPVAKDLQEAYFKASMEVARLQSLIENLSANRKDSDLQRALWKSESELAAVRWLLGNIVDERDALFDENVTLRAQ